VDFDLGDLFAEERRDILVTLELPPSSGAGPAQNAAIPAGFEIKGESLGVDKASSYCAHVRARGFSVEAKQFEETAKPGEGVELSVERQASIGKQDSHPQVVRHRNRHMMTKALEDARVCARGSDLAAARAKIDSVISEVSASPLTLQGDVTCLGLLGDLKACRKTLEHESVYRQRGVQMLSNCEVAHTYQRSCNSTPATEMYMNNVQRSYRSVFMEHVSGTANGSISLRHAH
jgi:hypothetical protein